MARLGFVVSQIREIEEARQKRLEQAGSFERRDVEGVAALSSFGVVVMIVKLRTITRLLTE